MAVPAHPAAPSHTPHFILLTLLKFLLFHLERLLSKAIPTEQERRILFTNFPFTSQSQTQTPVSLCGNFLVLFGTILYLLVLTGK